MKRRSKPQGFGFGTPLLHPRELIAHREIAEFYDKGKAADLLWFRLHPRIREYERPPHPGELELMSVMANIPIPKVKTIRVCLGRDGCRTRSLWCPDRNEIIDFREI